MLTLLAKFLSALNSDDSPAQIALAIALGTIMGLTPLWSVHNLIVLFFALVIRINISALIVAVVVTSGLGLALDAPFNALGLYLLQDPNYLDTWTELYNSPYWRVADFNNTFTLGSLVAAVVMSPLVFLSSIFIVNNYRQHILEWVLKTRIMTFLKTTRFYQIYLAVSS